MKNFQYITEAYISNCMIEAIKAKIRNPNIRIYFCKPRITENGNFQMFHFMWSDGNYDYDFSDDDCGNFPWYKCFLFKGMIRRFPLGFAEKYTKYRNYKFNGGAK